ncbi:MAG: 16S rRNA processing protein RimM [Ktedonobacteraceae bacterium]|nr:16S rRNA processing protein RimM [Ktedonobacteraceae bacterium]
MQNSTEWATIGKIVAPLGLHGELKVLSLTDIPNRFATVGKVYLGPQRLPYAVNAVRPYKGEVVILKLVGIDDITGAELLRNCDLAIPLDKLAQLPADSYYQHDIIGLQVRTVRGREIGEVVDIIVTGSNDVYVMRSADGREVLVPAIKEVIKQIDLVGRMMYIEPMDGILDDEAVLVQQDDQTKEEIE